MSEITKPGEKIHETMPGWVWLGLAAIVVCLYFFGLSIPLLGPDEPRYAQVAREMFERGDWVTPTLGGFHWFEKPALLYWLQIASYKIFGVSEFAARFGSALFGLGTVACLWILGRFTQPTSVDFTAKRQTPTADFANYLALIAASTLGIIVFSRGASFDIVVTFPMTAALVSFYIFDQQSSPPYEGGVAAFRGRGGSLAASADGVVVRLDNLPISPTPRLPFSLVLFYFFIGVAVLAKGLIGIVFPFAIVGLYYLLSWRRPGKVFVASLVWGTVLAVAVAGVWYVPMYLRHGYEFIDEFFIQHHFQRFTSNKYQHPQPFHFFLWVLRSEERRVGKEC